MIYPAPTTEFKIHNAPVLFMNSESHSASFELSTQNPSGYHLTLSRSRTIYSCESSKRSRRAAFMARCESRFRFLDPGCIVSGPPAGRRYAHRVQ